MSDTLLRYLCFLVPMLISAVLVVPVKHIAWKLNIFAVENNRTVHEGKIPRIGGIAVFIAFMIGSLIFLDIDRALQATMTGGFIVFLGGLIDDIYDLKPRYKILFQAAGALVVILWGAVEINAINLPFGITIPKSIFSYILTFFWLLGITNAINLLDGLDGLSSGFSIIVLMTIALLCTVVNRWDVLLIALVLAGSTMGFLFYNFHPASIFIGDCGAQYLGFMIASLSIMGFKSGTFITLLIPIILLFVPIMDTVSAIIRRKLSGHKFSDADMGHLHHALMRRFNLGQRETVLIIYGITTMFGFTAYIYTMNAHVGLIMLVIMIVICDLIIEATGMISNKYHPLMDLLRKFKQDTVPENRNQ